MAAHNAGVFWGDRPEICAATSRKRFVSLLSRANPGSTWESTKQGQDHLPRFGYSLRHSIHSPADSGIDCEITYWPLEIESCRK
jgi:hypothetical protein